MYEFKISNSKRSFKKQNFCLFKKKKQPAMALIFKRKPIILVKCLKTSTFFQKLTKHKKIKNLYRKFEITVNFTAIFRYVEILKKNVIRS